MRYRSGPRSALAHHDAGGGVGEGVARGDEGGGLSAQFQGHRGEMGARRGHHLSADGSGTGEQEVVEGQGGEGAGEVKFSAHDGEFVALEVAGKQAGKRQQWPASIRKT